MSLRPPDWTTAAVSAGSALTDIIKALYWAISVKILSIDVGGTSVKVLASGRRKPFRFLSGRTMTPAGMVSEVTALARHWEYDVVSIGYPGRVHDGRIIAEPRNLASGWVGFDFGSAFGRPVRIINDAAMQALGSYRGGELLFLGFGTGLGSAIVVPGSVIPMELGNLSYRMRTYEQFIGDRGLKRLGRRKWRKHVEFVVSRLIEAIHPDDVVLGGGNARNLSKLPPRCRLGDNSRAFTGGFRLWDSKQH